MALSVVTQSEHFCSAPKRWHCEVPITAASLAQALCPLNLQKRACLDRTAKSALGKTGDIPSFLRHAGFAPKNGHSVYEIVGWVKRLAPRK
jgi:hypothetical protein